jgi:hypothetical protein
MHVQQDLVLLHLRTGDFFQHCDSARPKALHSTAFIGLFL